MRVEESKHERDLVFKYDATGNRILKIAISKGQNANIRATSYHRDAQGNVLSTEESDAVPTSTPSPIPTTREYTLYGSSRLGVFKTYALGTTPQVGDYYMTKTDKYYELTNHLGNVMAVLSDAKHYDHNAQHFTTLTAQAQDYMPFGMMMPGRKYENVGMKYRYTFNGQEQENELNPSITSALYWMYDGRTIRRWNVDPVTYPWQSSYATFNNSPILYSDPLGLWGKKSKAETSQQKMIDKLGEDGKDRVGEIFNRKEGTGKKEDWGYHVYDEGKDKHIHTEGNLEEGVSVFAHRPDASVFSNKGFKEAKSKFGLYTPYYLSANASFVFAGGGSYTVGFAQDKFGGRTGFHTIGGGVGLNLGIGVNSGGFRDEGNNKFKVHQLEGRGFQYGGGVWFLSGQLSGNDPYYDNFRVKGVEYTAIEGGGNLGKGYKALNWTKLSKLTNIEVGASYQWTFTYPNAGASL